MEVSFCVAALEDALAHHGKPRSSIPIRAAVHRLGLHRRLTKQSIAISMDGKGAWRDNVFVERLWRTIKYEEVYLRAYESVAMHALRSAAICNSTMNDARMRALTA